ncbi:MAG: baseplate J/gp47 family protein [Bacteroides sp.]
MGKYADRTYDAILAEMLATAPAGVDVRQGSIFFDAVAACAFKISKYYADADCISELLSIDTSSGEYLDEKGKDLHVFRNQATYARYSFTSTGTSPTLGARFFTEGQYFKLVEATGTRYLDAEEPGEGGNHIVSGTAATPVSSIEGLTSASFGTLAVPGADTENDSDYRDRMQEKIAGPAQNGNAQHYKTWSEEVTGVGRARIIPLWKGANTVKTVLLDTTGKPASPTIVANVQAHIDPGGLGLGDGTANIGSFVTAIAATAVTVAVKFTATLAAGYTTEDAKAAATAAITTHLKALALDTPDSAGMVVRLSTIGALLYALPPIIDYSGLTLNGTASNIEIAKTEVAVPGEVTVNAALR